MSPHAGAVALLTSWTAPDVAQERLRRDYVEFLGMHDDALSRDCVPYHLTGSALIVDPVNERVLLLLHAKAALWLPAGGHSEPDDTSLLDTALREASEESGIDGLRPGAAGEPIRLHRHPAPCRPGVVDQHLDVQFLVVSPPAGVPAASAESRDVRWFDFDHLPSPSGPDVAELVSIARSRLA